jgi:IS5 family transposase
LIEAGRAQRSFGDGFTAEINDLQQPWMAHVDAMLADEAMVSAVHQAIGAAPSPKPPARQTGFPCGGGAAIAGSEAHPQLEHAVLEREVRANLVYRDFTRVGAAKMPDAKTMGRWAWRWGRP